MKKIISGCLTLSMVFCLASGFTSAAEEQNALERIQESGKLVMATDAAWPPFEFMAWMLPLHRILRTDLA